MMSACGDDPCNTLCQSVADALETCINTDESWDLSWEELGADAKYDWRVRCQSEWDAKRAELEAREVPASETQCEDAASELTELRDDGACDELRVLYLD